MPNVDVNIKRGYDANVPIEKLWDKLSSGTITSDFCIPLGQNNDKEDRYLSLHTSPHIIAAGSALSGLGMFRRISLATFVKFNSPEDIQLILVDPLKISFFDFKNIDKYLVYPVITDNRKAISALEWAKEESDRRYNLIVANKYRNIEQYNEDHPDKIYPKIVIFITELGEFISSESHAEKMIVQIIQMTKATGIHLFLTTQRPTEKVITPFLKANIFTRIAFQSGSREGSIAILGREGAEELLGQGDMIVDNFGVSERLQEYHLEI